MRRKRVTNNDAAAHRGEGKSHEAFRALERRWKRFGWLRFRRHRLIDSRFLHLGVNLFARGRIWQSPITFAPLIPKNVSELGWDVFLDDRIVSEIFQNFRPLAAVGKVRRSEHEVQFALYCGAADRVRSGGCATSRRRGRGVRRIWIDVGVVVAACKAVVFGEFALAASPSGPLPRGEVESLGPALDLHRPPT